MGLVVRTSKTNGWGQREVKYLVCKGSAREDMLVDYLVVWVKMAEYESPTVMFFSNRAASGQKKVSEHHVKERGGTKRLSEEAVQHQVLQSRGSPTSRH